MRHKESEWLWVKLDPAKVPSERLEGVNIEVLWSPYDVPQAVRGHYDEALGRFVIEFRYISDEPYTRAAEQENVTLRIGRHSRRLHGIEINVNRLKAEAVALRMRVPELVDQALERLVGSRLSPAPADNYRLAKAAVSKRKDQLFESLATA